MANSVSEARIVRWRCAGFSHSCNVTARPLNAGCQGSQLQTLHHIGALRNVRSTTWAPHEPNIAPVKTLTKPISTPPSAAATVSSWRMPLAAALLCLALPSANAVEEPKSSRFYEDALTRFEKNDMPGAIIQLKNALKVDNKNLAVQVLLGKALLANNDLIAAEVAFEEALRLGVNRAEVVLPLAQALLGQGKPQPLMDQPRFADVGLPQGTRSQLLLLKANAAGDLGDSRSALRFIEEARAGDPSQPETWMAEVPVRLRALQIREATAAADKALALAPSSAQAAYLRGTVSHLLADRTAAMTYYNRALQSRPTHTEALVARAGIFMDLDRIADAARDVEELRKSSSRDPRGAYIRALIAEREGKPEVTRIALNEVTSLLDPVPIEFIRFRPQLLLLAGLAHYGLNEREKAKPYLELALRGQPGSPVSKLLAQIHLSEKNVDRAIEALDLYLKGHPNDVQATHLLASAHMSQGRPARATALMQAALRKQDLPELHSMLGLSLMGTGKYGGAVNELESAIKRDPGQVQAGSALAAIYMQSGQASKAVRVAEALVKHQPEQAALHSLLGSARARSGDAAGARGAFEQAIKLNAAATSPQIGLARLDAEAKSFDSAAARLNVVLAANAKNVEALIEMGRVDQRQGKMAEAQRWLEKADDHSGPDNLQPALTLVDFHLASNRPDLALEAVKRLTNKAPEAVSVLITTARVYLANGDAASAKPLLSRAATQANYDAPLLVDIALLQIKANHLQGAAYSVDKALSERSDYLPAIALMADVELRQGDLGKAEQRARQIIANHPKRGLGHAILGDVAVARGQRTAAVDAYRRAHQIDQSTASVLRLYAALAAVDGAAATQLAEQWLKVHVRDLAVRRALADGYARNGNLVAARGAYETLLKAVPDDAEALNNLANVLLLAKDPGALKVAEMALARSPGVPHIIGTAGWAAFKAGQPDRALQLLRDARLRDPNNAETRYFLGAVLASVGRTSEARTELEGALRGGREFVSANDAERLLGTLR